MRTTGPYRFTSRIIRNKYTWQEILLIVLALVWIRVLGCIMESGGGNHWIDLTFGMRLSRSAATVLVNYETYNITQRQNLDCARSYTEVFYSACCSWYWYIFISALWLSPWSMGDVAIIEAVKSPNTIRKPCSWTRFVKLLSIESQRTHLMTSQCCFR